jgi:signal transduction histidine kinase
MPKLDGLSLLTKIKETQDNFNPALNTIVISAYDDMPNVRRAMNLGAFDFLTKPLNMTDLRITVQKTVEHIEIYQQHLQQKQAAEQALRQLNSELEQRVEERTNQLMQMNAELNAFTRTVAHNLKSPLSTLLGYANYAVSFFNDVSANDLLELLRQTQVSGYQALYIIDELLLLASVQLEQVEPMPLDMASIVNQAQERLHPMIVETQATITQPKNWPIPEGHGPWVEEVWVNYLSNGLKYGGKPPHLEIGVETKSEGVLRFWVQDNGPDITPEIQVTLFTEFTRLDPSHLETGQGLGLSAVKRIVEKLGGEVGVINISGQGNMFYFTLPNAER